MRQTVRAVAALGVFVLGGIAVADTIEIASPNEEDFGLFGCSVAAIGDLNGDGATDFVVGACDENGAGQTDSGRAYVYSGRTGGLIRTHSSPNAEFGGNYGISVAGIPDINGDGIADYIVGASEENGLGFTDSGRAYVYSGATGALIRTHTSPNAANFSRFGSAVGGMTDLNGDARGDYIIGAPNETAGGQSGSGRVYVYSGSSGALIRSHQSPNPNSSGNFGTSVAGVPDATNDGRGDYIVGAPFEDGCGGSPSDAGRAYFYNGSSGALLPSPCSPNEESAGRFGISVAGVPDANGDGRGDILVGAWLEDPGASPQSAGRAYLYSGNGAGLLHELVSPNEELSGNFGVSVSGVKDRDGDGRGDLVVGAQGEERAYVFSGSTGSLLETFTYPNASTGQYGYAVAGLADVNGDLRGDVVVGAWTGEGDSGTPPNAGRVFLYRIVDNNSCNALFGDIPTIGVGATFFTTIGATASGAEQSCGDFTDFGPDVWFHYVADCTTMLTVGTCNSVNYDSVLGIYDGCGFSPPFFACNLATLIACDDDTPGCGLSQQITIPVVEGQCYRIRVGGFNDATGFGNLVLQTNPSCCPADFDQNGVVDGADLGRLLAVWGTPGTIEDLDGSGTVDGADLGLLLSAWGPC
ncbi:MAG: FG-GAP repeat protein [Phycisphaerales bacterium]|nr:FG-GAP repeat protein [Phycisphaerales bacterium]